jgi:hypothetical protein
VSVFTGGKSVSIDSGVYIQLYGDDGISVEKKLKQSFTHDTKFDKYHADVFSLEMTSLGTLYALKVRHDNVGVYNEWNLDRIEICEDDFTYKFFCKNWLASSKKDGKIERTLIEENALQQFDEFDF